MEYCRYHPLAPATYSCPHCGISVCDKCIDEGERGGEALCFNCKRQLQSLGAANHATPFWRRLEESFRYPMNSNAAGLIIAVSVLTTILFYVPLGFILSLMITGAFVKYCFTALDNTASGILVAPNITEAYDGGIGLLLRLLAIFVVIGGASYGIWELLGAEFAGVFIFLSVMALPAIIIIFAMSDSLGEALNPANVISLITAIGLPYGLLLGFIMIMTASVGVINTLFAGNFSTMSTILQSVVTNYYTLVLFHIMGYMIFQYQGALGFTAREDTGEERPPRPERDRLATKIDIRLKEGEYNDVVRLLKSALDKFPIDSDFQKQYFEFIYATERLQALESVATDYLVFLIRSNQEHQLSIIYKRVLHLMPNFLPSNPLARHHLAIACKQRGDPKSTVKLINGMQKTFPDYMQLAEAFDLMADALNDLPGKDAQAVKCRELAKRIAAKQPSQTKPKEKTQAGLQQQAVAPPKKVSRAVFAIDNGTLAATNPTTIYDSSEEHHSLEQQNDTPLPKPDLPPIEFK